MTKPRKKGEEVREFVLETVENNPGKAVALTMQRFGISRQAVHRHIKRLVDQDVLVRVKSGRYELRPQEEWSATLTIADNPHEDVVWRKEIAPRIGPLPDNALSIWNYGFTEMFNNVVDHSQSPTVWIEIKKTHHATEMVILDDGVGIFHKIKETMHLLDERHAVLELTKGKLTTDPAGHSGEGIFFTSRVFDAFSILSGEVVLLHEYGAEHDWIFQSREDCKGTLISLKLRNNTSRTIKEVFDKFTSGDDFGFTKTVVPVRLALYGNEKLISRSQAKRVLERVDKFRTVLLDFNEVDAIGQAFADEAFRVFVNQHPHTEILPINANEDIMRTINRARQKTEE